VIEYTESTVETTGGMVVETHTPQRAVVIPFPSWATELDAVMRDCLSTPYATTIGE